MPGKHEAKNAAAGKTGVGKHARQTQSAEQSFENEEFTSWQSTSSGRSSSTYVFPEPMTPQDYVPSTRVMPATSASSNAYGESGAHPGSNVYGEPKTYASSNTYPPPNAVMASGAQGGYGPYDAPPEYLYPYEPPRRKRHWGLIAAIIIVLVLAAAAAVALFVINPFGALPEEEAVVPETAVVARENFSASVQVSGTINPAAEIYVNAEVPGIIREVKAREGQFVRTGDILIVMKNSNLEEELSDAESALEKANDKVSEEQSKVDSAQDDYQKAVDEYNDAIDEMNKTEERAREAGDKAYDKAYDEAINAIPEDATDKERAKLLDEAESTAQKAYDKAYDKEIENLDDPGEFDHDPYVSEVEAAQSKLDEATEKQEKAQNAYDKAKEDVNKLTIMAPATGTLLNLNATPGAAVGGASGGSSTVSGELAHIADLSMLTVEVEVNELDVSDIRNGQTSDVTVPALDGFETQAKVVKVDSTATTASGENASAATDGNGAMYKVTLLIEKPDERLKPGMSADANIKTKNVPNVCVIPSGAVMGGNNDPYVFVVTDEETMAIEKRSIVIAARSSAQVAVKSGLEKGDIVLVDPSAAAQAASTDAHAASSGAAQTTSSDASQSASSSGV